MTLTKYTFIFLLLGALSLGCGEKKASPVPTEEKAASDSEEVDSADVFNDQEEVYEDIVEEDPYGEQLEEEIDDAGFGADDIPDDGAGGGFNIGDAMGLIGPVMNAMKSGDIGSALGPILDTMGGAGGAGGGLGQMADLLPALTGLLGGQ